MIKTIYFVRHGETIENTQGILIGTQPGKLTSKGKVQAYALAEYFRPRCINCIYSSPLQRAQDTAAIISEKMSKEVRVMESLQERDLGNLNGVSRKEFRLLWDNQKDQLHFRPSGGESYLDILDRVRQTLSILKQENHHKIMVVSHGRFLKLLINYVLRRDPRFPVQQDNGCINVVNYNNKIFTVEKINVVP